MIALAAVLLFVSTVILYLAPKRSSIGGVAALGVVGAFVMVVVAVLMVLGA